MALDAGNRDATAGMARYIYDQMVAVIEPELRADLARAGLSDAQIRAAVEAARKSWRRQGYTVAAGVIAGIRDSELLLWLARLRRALTALDDVAAIKHAIQGDTTTGTGDIT